MTSLKNFWFIFTHKPNYICISNVLPLKNMNMEIIKDSKESIMESLDAIANDLIKNKALIINDAIYSIIDLEIYYWHHLHPDNYTNDHIRPIGEFELHRYGVDLSLGNQDEVDFGGILIRGLFDIKKYSYCPKSECVITKSDVVRTIYNNICIGHNRFELIDYKTPWTNVFQSVRINLSDDSNKEKYKKSPYKYLAKDKELYLKYPKKEKIFTDSILSKEEKNNFIGYNLIK